MKRKDSTRKKEETYHMISQLPKGYEDTFELLENLGSQTQLPERYEDGRELLRRTGYQPLTRVPHQVGRRVYDIRRS